MLVSAALFGAVILGQPEPGAIEAARRFSSAHAETTFAERASIVITDDAGEVTTFETTLRRSDSTTQLELPGLRLYFAEAVLTAERLGEPNPAVVFRIENAGDDFLSAIGPHVPPMPMPQLWRFDDQGRCADPALGAIEVERFEPERSTLVARTQAGEIELILDEDTSHARSLDAPLGGSRFHADYESLDPGDPTTWAISTEGRWVVTRLAQLSPPRSPIEPGIQLDDLNLSTPSYQGWKLSEIQSDEAVRRSGPWVVLLLCRADAEDEVFDLAGEVASQLWHSAASEIAELGTDNPARYWLGHRSIVVAVSGELKILPEQMQTLADRSPRGVPLMVSTEPASTIDRLRIPAPLTAILVDPERTVGAVVPIENAETGVSAVLDAMRSFVRRDKPVTASDSGE